MRRRSNKAYRLSLTCFRINLLTCNRYPHRTKASRRNTRSKLSTLRKWLKVYLAKLRKIKPRLKMKCKSRLTPIKHRIKAVSTKVQ